MEAYMAAIQSYLEVLGDSFFCLVFPFPPGQSEMRPNASHGTPRTGLPFTGNTEAQQFPDVHTGILVCQISINQLSLLWLERSGVI